VGPHAKTVSVDNFRHDPMFPRLERAAAKILATGKVVAPVEVLVRMDLLTPADLEAWRFGSVPYLERVIRGNLSRLGRLLRILRFHAHDLNLVPSHTAYVRWGRGPRTPLRFTKTGERKVEEAYARHFVWPGKGAFHGPRERTELLSQVLLQAARPLRAPGKVLLEPEDDVEPGGRIAERVPAR
jgi:hypothetical protein